MGDGPEDIRVETVVLWIIDAGEAIASPDSCAGHQFASVGAILMIATKAICQCCGEAHALQFVIGLATDEAK